MNRIVLIALLAATASPALAADFTTETPAPTAARDIGDRAEGNTFAARDIADRKDFQISELGRDERGGIEQPAARDIGDRAEGNTFAARDIADRKDRATA